MSHHVYPACSAPWRSRTSCSSCSYRTKQRTTRVRWSLRSFPHLSFIYSLLNTELKRGNFYFQFFKSAVIQCYKTIKTGDCVSQPVLWSWDIIRKKLNYNTTFCVWVGCMNVCVVEVYCVHLCRVWKCRWWLCCSGVLQHFPSQGKYSSSLQCLECNHLADPFLYYCTQTENNSRIIICGTKVLKASFIPAVCVFCGV